MPYMLIEMPVLNRGVKTSQPDPFWPDPSMVQKKWVGPDWPIKQKWTNNHNPSRIRRANRAGRAGPSIFFLFIFIFFKTFV